MPESGTISSLGGKGNIKELFSDYGNDWILSLRILLVMSTKKAMNGFLFPK